ncbi:GSU2403 family nucleotidyltransferase fold protein, partial [bacterium]
MRDKQIELLFKVLRILQKKGALKHLVVVGSWCMYFYNFYFNKLETIASLRTRDVDFMIPDPKLLKIEIDLPEILKPLGFVIDYRGKEGYMRLVHPEFFIEFLVPKKGKDSDKAFTLPSLGLNAQRLRFLDILYLKTVPIRVNGIKLIVSHP